MTKLIFLVKLVSTTIIDRSKTLPDLPNEKVKLKICPIFGINFA